jgi:hypothetical protein
MHRPLTRRQQLECTAFCRALAATGNIRLACAQTGLNRSTLFKRRAAHPRFALEWDAALAAAHATLRASGKGEGDRPARPAGGGAVPQTPILTHGRHGRPQLRLSGRARRITPAAIHAFLAALSATANVRLAARAAGFAHSSFYALAARDPAFEREMDAALALGVERLEMALLESTLADPNAHAEWRHNDPPPIPPMSADQALHLMTLHQRRVHFQHERPDRAFRKRENIDRETARIRTVRALDHQREREARALAKAHAASDRDAARHGPGPAPPAPILPALDQLTGWSSADPAKGNHGPSPLFGGWRLANWWARMTEEERESWAWRNGGSGPWGWD